jgi:hypothetical protein
MKGVICLLLGFVLSGCAGSIREQSSIPLIRIDIDRIEILKLSDFFAEVSYVPLTDSFLVSTVERAKVYGDKLFLLTDKSVLVFDLNTGESLSSIRHLGDGPGEYISLYDMLYDKNENIIELLDMNGQKVLRYGMNDHFISEFKTSFSSFSFYKIAPSAYLFYNNNMISDVTDRKLVRYDARTSKITASWFPIDKHLASYFFTVDANNFGSVLTPSFHFCPSDTIYGFTDNCEPSARYVLNFGKNHTPAQFYKKNYSDIFDFSVKATRQNYIYLYDNFCENDYAAMFFFRNDKNIYWVLYDKNTQTAHVTDQWMDDYHSGTSIHTGYGNGPFVMDDTSLYFFLQPDQLIDLMKNEKRSNGYKSHSNILDSLYHSSDFSEQSNPIIVKCKFRGS